MANCTKCLHQGFLDTPTGFATVAIHAGQDSDKWKSLAVAPPITLSSTFKQPRPGEPAAYIYGRIGNPMRNTLEECLAALEGAKYGFAFASGLGAITTVCMLLKRGDHMVSMDDLYGGTNSLLGDIVTRMGIEVTFSDITIPGNLEKSIKPNTKMLFFETPTNPVLKVVDIAAAVKTVKSRGDILVVADNTFLTSYLQKPMKFGADIVLYSLTKYMNGHTDVVMGAVVVNDKELAGRLQFLQGEQPTGFATVAIHAGQDSDKWKSLAVAPPITLSSTFKQPRPGEPAAYIYGRIGNPMRNTLEECLAALEGAKYGFAFSSGLGAVTTVCMLLKRGDHIVSMDDLNSGTTLLLGDIMRRLGIEVTIVDITVPGNLEKSIKANTKMLFFETPTNPILKIVDIAAAVKTVKTRGDILVVVDNTFLTCYFQKPMEFGADIVLYSLTKYMNGHSDVVMGAVVVNDKELAGRLQFLQGVAGIVPSPFDCYMVNRSLKTLALRMERHKESALLIAGWLDMHPKVVEVLHPGLPSHIHHEIAKKQMSGHSGVFSFRHCGDLKESRKFLCSLKIFTLAVSLGGYDSLAELPSLMTHSFVPEKERLALGITNSLIRLSIGLEDVLDLIEDLDRAFREAFK